MTIAADGSVQVDGAAVTREALRACDRSGAREDRGEAGDLRGDGEIPYKDAVYGLEPSPARRREGSPSPQQKRGDWRK